MPKKWTPLQKAEAIQYLIGSVGNVDLCSEKLGIPTSTLYEWKREIREGGGTVRLHRLPPTIYGDNITSHLLKLRDEIVTMSYRAVRYNRTAYDIAEQSTSVLTLTRLLKQLEGIQKAINEYTDHHLYIHYTHPDGNHGRLPFDESEYDIVKKPISRNTPELTEEETNADEQIVEKT